MKCKTVSPHQNYSAIELFANENYLDEFQDTEFKRTVTLSYRMDPGKRLSFQHGRVRRMTHAKQTLKREDGQTQGEGLFGHWL